MTAENHIDTKTLALTPWGASTIDALQAASEREREEVARRACEDAITDARNMVGLQGSLFEKLLVIERFGLYRSHGCDSIQEFIEKTVAPTVQLHRKTLFKLREAVWEAGRLLERFGTLKADWTNLCLLATESRRREKGGAVLPAERYEQLSQQVAEGRVSRRELADALQRRREKPPAIRAEKARTEGSPGAPRPPARSPLDELALITAEVRRPAAVPAADLAPAIDMGARLLPLLERLLLQPADALARRPGELFRFRCLMVDLARVTSSASEVARRMEAA